MAGHRWRRWPAALAIAALVTIIAPLAGSSRAAAESAEPADNGVAAMTPAAALATAGATMAALVDARYDGNQHTLLTGDADLWQSVRHYTRQGCSEVLRRDQLTVRYVVKGKHSYWRAPKSVWRALGAPRKAARRLHEKWVRSKASKAERLGCTPAAIVPAGPAAEGYAARSAPPVDGRPGVEMYQAWSDHSAGFTIATTGPAHVLRLFTGASTGESAYLYLRGMDEGTRIVKPRRARTLQQWLRR